MAGEVSVEVLDGDGLVDGLGVAGGLGFVLPLGEGGFQLLVGLVVVVALRGDEVVDEAVYVLVPLGDGGGGLPLVLVVDEGGDEGGEAAEGGLVAGVAAVGGDVVPDGVCRVVGQHKAEH